MLSSYHQKKEREETKMKKILKKVSKETMMVMISMAVAVAPTASEFCRAAFYEEKKPEGISKLCERREK